MLDAFRSQFDLVKSIYRDGEKGGALGCVNSPPGPEEAQDAVIHNIYQQYYGTYIRSKLLK